MVDQALGLNKFGNRRGMNPGSSLGRFKKDGGGNPHNDRGGSPVSLVALLKEELKRIPSKNQEGGDNTNKLTNAQLLVRVIVENALDGNTSLAKEILDRVDGKPAMTLTNPLVEVHQNVKVVSQEEIKPALEALVECGVVQICQN